MVDAVKEDVKVVIRDAMERLKNRLPGFVSRPSQRMMIAECTRVLSGYYGVTRIAAIEAPTGTGKSVAYLIASIPVAQAEEKSLIVSTATVALQEQLVDRDLPRLAETTGLDFTFKLAKGRRRYACNRNVAQLSGSNVAQAELGLGEPARAHWDHAPSDAEVHAVQAMERTLGDGSWNGDLDLWPEAIPDALKSSITTDQHSCTGRACPQYSNCAYLAAREGLKKADVVVANHDLVLSDLGLGGGVVLPSPEDSFYIFDEGHHLPAVAVSHGAASGMIKGGISGVDRLGRDFADAISTVSGPGDIQAKTVLVSDLIDGLTRDLRDIEPMLEAVLDEADQQRPGPKSNRARNDDVILSHTFPLGVVPPAIVEKGADISEQVNALAKEVRLLLNRIKKAVSDGDVPEPIASKHLQTLGIVQGRLDGMADAWYLFSETRRDASVPPVARWLELVDLSGRKKGMDIRISAATTSAAHLLRTRLFDQAAGVILTSATLTALGRFDRLCEQAGLSRDDGTQFVRLPSPFDIPNNGILSVPRLNTDPGNPSAHTEEVATWLNANVDTGKGTLVLFSSRRQMLDVADMLDPVLKGMTLVQNEKPKGQILAEHEERIRAGKGSMIFGLASFAEGVDLPETLCEHVIITKIPFAVPDSPIDATYADWLKSRGRNPFIEVSVPDAGVKLVQASGRLLRTERDTGIVTLLDRRIVTKRYGKQLLDGLPPFSRKIA